MQPRDHQDDASHDVAGPAPSPAYREIGVRELKAHASEIIREVETLRQSIVVTRNGKPRAYLVPFDGPSAQVAEQLPATRRTLRDAYPELPEIPEDAFHHGRSV